MKTKTNILVGIFLFLSSCFLSINTTFAGEGVIPLTSGIKAGYYTIKWCSPHKGLPNCGQGYFNRDGSIGKLTYKGENFANGNLSSIKIENPPSSTRVASSGFLGLFDGITELQIEGEGEYTIDIFLIDYADNTSETKLVYQVDKTAPQFQLTGITEDSSYAYVDENPRVNGTIQNGLKKFDSANNGSDSTSGLYNNPILDNYSGEIPVERSDHTRNNLYTIYYKDSGIGFNLGTLVSDTFQNMQNPVSGIKNYELYDSNHNLKSTLSSLSSLTTSNLGLGNNSQGNFIVRVYDNTTGKAGVNGGKGNYSEIAFYAVRDNTPPNMGNNLASNEQDAIKKLLGFNLSTTAWDTSASGNNSKFLAASSAQLLYSILNDTGIGNGTDYAKFNAGIPRGGRTKIEIEKSDTLNEFSEVFIYDNRFVNTPSKQKNFSLVDNNRSNGYRKYPTKFTTSGIGDGKICDNVGNCLNPSLDFRVVANELDKGKSNITIGFNSNTGDNKIFANGQDKFNMETSLKDAYGNAIVGVTAVENGSKKIKSIDVAFNYQNGLNSDQLDKSGDKLVSVTDLLSSKNKSTSDIGGINNSGKLYFAENEEVGKTPTNLGTYKYTLSSLVPSNSAYPYLTNDAVLKLLNINPKANTNTSGVGVYGNIGSFNTTINGNGTTKLITSNTQFLNKDDYTTDLDVNEKGNYGIVSLENPSPITYTDFSNTYNLDFPFASPMIYGAENLSLNHLIANIGQTKEHTKKLFTFNGLSKDDTLVFEQYLPAYSTGANKFTPNIFNIYSALDAGNIDNNKINSGVTINGSTLDSTGEKYLTKSSPIKNNYQIAGYGFNMGYVSSINYDILGKTIKLPSISRNISDFATKDDPKNENENKKASGYYFPIVNAEGTGDYAIIGDPVKTLGLLSGLGIAITGLSNQEDLMIVDKDAGRKANLNVGENLNRYDLITSFKKNVEKYASSLGNGNTKRWCSDLNTININQDDLNDPSNTLLNNCTIKISGETISFIKGDININCATNNTCILNNNLKRTIIIKDGSTYISSNITTLNKNSGLLIGTIADAGLKNITIPTGDNPDLPRNNTTYGWTLINPSVTNIDAFIVSQGPMISYSGTKVYNAPTETDLKNQLHIYGSTLSLNTVGGYKDETNSKCPYIVSNCSQKNAFIFDLVTLRRYSLVGESAGSDNLIPSGNGFRSGRNKGPLTTNGDNPPKLTSSDNSGSYGLRYINDTDYIVYPLFVERDTYWNKSPSIMSKIVK
ncbi:hypothetical protein H3C61_04600 [Candidatus Gracilibacteria bacterium]|nr:hypothetical protein [Candidatus Gracilibacteria bacterium]